MLNPYSISTTDNGFKTLFRGATLKTHRTFVAAALYLTVDRIMRKLIGK